LEHRLEILDLDVQSGTARGDPWLGERWSPPRLRPSLLMIQ
jgi:hypothetical protein